MGQENLQEQPPENATALARKRRREKIISQRNEQRLVTDETVQPHQGKDMHPDNIPSASERSTKKQRSQMRYEPDIPMSKEETAAWRREARRVRNRESAAASRRKTRDRIAQLESEVQDWKEKYLAALQRLKEIESSSVKENSKTRALLNAVSIERSALENQEYTIVSPCSSPVLKPKASPAKVDENKL
eukprot:CAMPEP_0172499836 /NCGR_PEP_ID=MMETSP1066-20121228/131645_1 /TAXON_ID=671091 /ORGANISM="Coscinodiscus wailesii, Strain CCMP2513" /LENGTH=188 /DNA_ID=CAMNT_0013273793 /DNA_START=74 /DNA_END=640 /DNA_ORIENTATION=+